MSFCSVRCQHSSTRLRRAALESASGEWASKQ
ncbi:protein dehydratase, partial [Klebsiella pneumoniae]